MSNREISDVIRNKEFVSVSATTLVRDAARLMKKHHTSAVLVIDRKEKLVGICTERDVVIDVVALGLDPDKTQVASIMTEDPRSIAPDKPFCHALHIMYEGGFRHVPVVDASGKPVGILTARDAQALDAEQFQHELVQREEITVIL